MRPILYVALTLLTAIASAHAAEVPRTVAVTGYAELQATPDRAQVGAGVVAQGATAAEAVASNNAAMRGVFDALGKEGIAEADIRTTGFSVTPVFDEQRVPRQAPRIVSYQASNVVTVVLRDTAAVGRILDSLVKGGANSLHGISFYVERNEELLDELRVAAIVDARRKARLMAEAAGATLGPVMQISENGRGGGPGPVMRLQAEAASVPVAAGTTSLSMSVSVTFGLN